MAQQATIKRFQVQLSHVDVGAYAALDLRLAQQPSENERFLFTRLLAYCWLYRDDPQSELTFSKVGSRHPRIRRLHARPWTVGYCNGARWAIPVRNGCTRR